MHHRACGLAVRPCPPPPSPPPSGVCSWSLATYAVPCFPVPLLPFPQGRRCGHADCPVRARPCVAAASSRSDTSSRPSPGLRRPASQRAYEEQTPRWSDDPTGPLAIIDLPPPPPSPSIALKQHRRSHDVRTSLMMPLRRCGSCRGGVRPPSHTASGQLPRSGQLRLSRLNFHGSTVHPVQNSTRGQFRPARGPRRLPIGPSSQAFFRHTDRGGVPADLQGVHVVGRGRASRSVVAPSVPTLSWALL